MPRLPTGQRQVLFLHFVQGFKYHEVAAKLGVALGTVQSRVFRARANRRAMLVKPDVGLGLRGKIKVDLSI